MPDTEIIFRPRRTRLLRIGCLLVVSGALTARAQLLALTRPGTIPDAHMIGLLGIAGVTLSIGIVMLLAPLFGRPRLTVDGAGVRLLTLFSTRWADWQSIGPFRVATAFGARRKQVLMGTATIAGPGISANLRGKTQFAIPDIFRTPLVTIVAEVNARHPVDAAVLAALPRAPDDTSVGVEGFRWPWLTIGLILVLIAVFVAEARLAIGPIGRELRLNVLTLKALGGIDRQAVVRDGQWYRLLTGPMLHASLAHLLGNTIALLIAGAALEKLLGRAWYGALFLLGAVGGGIGSLLLNRAGLVSVGASGAIMAMFAALLVTSFRLPRGGGRSRLQWRSIRILVPSLLPVTATVGGLTIDYGAHIGGAVTGAAIGFFVLRTWPETSRLPAFQPLAAAVAAIAVPLLVGGWGDVAAHYPHPYRPAAAVQAPRHDRGAPTAHP